MREEAQLIRKAARGDTGSFEQLVILKRRRVVMVAYQVTGDLEDARDVAQAVFITLWRAIGRYDPERSFDTWLYRITVNAAIDHLRRNGPKGFMQPLPNGEMIASSERSTEAERSVDAADIQKAFLRLASRLAPRQRAAFVLREIEGLPTAEVAEILGVVETTVRNHVMQARRVLREGIHREFPSLASGTGKAGEPR